MISCELKGGLGNQLFQVFTTIAYAMERGQQFALPMHKQTIGIDGTSQRGEYNATVFGELPHVNEFRDFAIVREKHHASTQLVNDGDMSMKNTKLIGYFQNPKLFDAYAKNIIAMMQIHQKREKLRCFLKQSSLAIHIRRGDYLMNKSHSAPLQIEYYYRAIDALQAKGLDTHAMVFYEHRCETTTHMIDHMHRKFPNIEFTEAPVLTDWESLLLMSLHTRFVIANSTFSFWAAFLRSKIDGDACIVYPAEWYKHGIFDDAVVDRHMDFDADFLKIYT